MTAMLVDLVILVVIKVMVLIIDCFTKCGDISGIVVVW